jgi:hypothetical protein
MFNNYNFNQTDTEVNDFVDATMGSDIGTLWSEKKPMNLSIDKPFFDQVREFDNEIFATRETVRPQ